MKALLIFLVVAVALANDSSVLTFRFKNGTLQIGDGEVVSIAGSVYHFEADDEVYFSMTGATKDMESFFRIGLGTASDNYNSEIDCQNIQVGLDEHEDLTGTAEIRGNEEEFDLIGDCVDLHNNHIRFEVYDAKVSGLYYSPKKAGLRAKSFIGETDPMFSSTFIIVFSTSDMLAPMDDCSYLDDSDAKSIREPEPGAIILGMDGQHCAILDDEGTKFIHRNPITHKVTYDSIDTIDQYFPNGVEYLRY